MALPEKISREIFQPVRGFTMKMNVRILNNTKEGAQEPFYNDFEFQHKRYMNLKVTSFITLEMIRQKDEPWSKDKSVSVNAHSIYTVISAFNRLKHAIYEEKIFAQKPNGDIVIYESEAQKHQETMNHLGNNQFMVAKAAIVFDDNEVSYEGVRLFLNNSSNYVDLPIDAFESVLHHLSQVNMFEYSQALLNFFIAYEGKEAMNAPKKRTTTFTHQPVQAVDTVKSNVKKDPKTFFGMN